MGSLKPFCLALLLVGCDHELPTLRLWHFGPENRGTPEPELYPEAAEACDIIGIECEASKNWRGSIYLDIAYVVGGQEGRTPKKPPLPCYPMTRTNTDPSLIAHELVHALGVVVHDDDPEKLTYEYSMRGEELSGAQYDIIEKGVRKLRRCRR